MELLSSFLPWIQIILSILLVGAILMQQSGAGVGGAFGGADGGGFYTRRGFEKFLFQATIVIAILFALSAFVALLL
ncbi:MAG: preprotein translocase subunit SecG [bacterium]|nr:preprotein translocase subunit SecG [bacterium]